MHIDSTTTRQRTNSRNQKIWCAHVDAWLKSGLSRAEYCRQHNLSHHQLRYWQKKYEQSSSAGVTFVPVPLVRAVKNNRPLEWKSALKVEVSDRFKIEVSDEFSPAILARLIITLESC